MKHYLLHRTPPSAQWSLDWDADFWRNADTAQVNYFHPESSPHRPATEAKMLYNDAALYIFFRVQDNYIRCMNTAYQSAVYTDSCVELFVQPKPNKGYFNIEMNCGGAVLFTYIEDPERLPGGGFKKYTVIPEEIGKAIEIRSSMPQTLPKEITAPTEWRLTARIPFHIFEKYIGEIEKPTQQEWRGNFYKCADESSQPHWASWSPIGEALNFHCPEYFGTLKFAE